LMYVAEKQNSSSSSTNTSTSSGLPPPPPPPSAHHVDLAVADSCELLHSTLLTPAASSVGSSGQGRGSSGATASVFLEEEEWDNVPRLTDTLCHRSLALPPPISPTVSLVFFSCLVCISVAHVHVRLG